ncbi:MAG: sigma 54-interacting transcriptional regulator [Gammaproteobacteria bacterium]
MDMHTRPLPFELQSLVETHTKPFVVVDSGYRILAVNSAYEKTFGIAGADAVGKFCHQVSHSSAVPCSEVGEDCPHTSLYKNGASTSCLHNHFDINNRACQVRVSAFPLRGSDGELYMGELIEELNPPAERRTNGKRMVGKSRPFLACIDQLKVAAATDAPVLVQGETGTGKELAARHIHLHSSRREQPFLTVDCTVLTDTLFEAEVFGHARGAFTGSVGERIGLFEQANGGTLFLDEIGELPLSQQAKLLRALETGHFRRVGGRHQRTSDVRIICATNRHLWDGVKADQFREDLYYRIACLAIRMPPLRERLNDIDVLAASLLERISEIMKRHFMVEPEAIQGLKQYDYPGNIRELRNVLFVAASRSTRNLITADLVAAVLDEQRLERQHELPDTSGPSRAARHAPSDLVTAPTLKDVEAQHIAELLQKHNHSRKLVAVALGVSERTLYRKLRRYNLS